MVDCRISCVLALFLLPCVSSTKYEPTWESIDSRPLPQWFDNAKIGISFYWGVYSVPGVQDELFWWRWLLDKSPEAVNYMKNNYKPDFTYPDFAPMLTGEFFNATEWADLLKAAGVKYFFLTAKHHEGYTLWPSKYSFGWNSMDVGLKRDVVGEVSKALRERTDIKFGVYLSLFEFYHPLYLQDMANNYTTHEFVDKKVWPEHYELVNKYKPDAIWSDGDWMVNGTYWNSTYFLAWLYNDSPVKDTIVVNDRWGRDIRCHHGGYLNCNDNYNPRKLQKRKWENCFCLDKNPSCSFRRDAALKDYYTIHDLLTELVQTVSCGGNFLLNVGPAKDGRIPVFIEENLRQMGAWLNVNAEAIYDSEPWAHQNDDANKDVWYTKEKGDIDFTVYGIILSWPQESYLYLDKPQPSDATTTVQLLGYDDFFFSWSKGATGGINITLPVIPFYKMPCQWAWTFKFDGLLN